MTPTYHIVSHTHWDREWYKSFEEFRSGLVSMVDDLLDLVGKDPSFRSFLLDGQAVVVEDYLEIRPERSGELRRAVSEGRLSIGPWYVLPDEFLVSGEALVRNLLAGVAFSLAHGGCMKVGYIPDSFGHTSMMPAILNGFGIDAALIYRGFGGERGQEASEYWWVSPDGSRCLMVHLPRNGYSGCYFYGEPEGKILERFARAKKELDARARTSHRLVMNGGDHHWPDTSIPRTIALLKKNFQGHFLHSSLPEYVEALKAEAPALGEVKGELRFGYRYAFAVTGGVYSSRMYLKQANWRTQALLERYAEPLGVLAALHGMKSPHSLLKQAWKYLLHNHPHDSICGTSIDSVHREMMVRFERSFQIARAVIEQSLGQIFPDACQAGDDRALYFFNPSPFPRSGPARATLKFFRQDVIVGLNPDVKVAPKRPPPRGFRLMDASGNEMPFQILSRREAHDIAFSHHGYPRQSLAEEYDVLIGLESVPPLGCAGLRVEQTKKFARYPSALSAGRNFLENEHLRADVSPRGILNITDKHSGTRYGGLHVFEDTGDVGDEYNYSYPARDERVRSGRRSVNITLAEKGPLRVALKVELRMDVPACAAGDRRSRSRRRVPLRMSSTLFLACGARSLEVETTVDNSAKDHRLRVLFPTRLKTRDSFADSQFCIAKRTQTTFNTKNFTIEHPAPVAPMQRFVTVKDTTNAFTVFASGLPEYELLPDGAGTIALTLLRCVGLLAGENLITRPGGRAGWHSETPEAQCQGRHVFRYALLPHAPGEEPELLTEESERFHLPLLALGRKSEPEPSLPMSLFSLSPPGQLVLSAVKEAEDGHGVIVRLYNPSGKNLKALLGSERKILKAALVRLDEEFVKKLDVGGEGDIRFSVAPSSIVTVRLEVA
jgi:mannosylglycerate hydrolase